MMVITQKDFCINTKQININVLIITRLSDMVTKKFNPLNKYGNMERWIVKTWAKTIIDAHKSKLVNSDGILDKESITCLNPNMNISKKSKIVMNIQNKNMITVYHYKERDKQKAPLQMRKNGITKRLPNYMFHQFHDASMIEAIFNGLQKCKLKVKSFSNFKTESTIDYGAIKFKIEFDKSVLK